MKDILSEMGAVYTGAEINAWMRYHYQNNTPYKQVVIDFLRAYGNYGLAFIDRRYMICRTADYPKSAAANGNRDGEYMLRRVGGARSRGKRNQKKRWEKNTRDRRECRLDTVRNDLNVFYI